MDKDHIGISEMRLRNNHEYKYGEFAKKGWESYSEEWSVRPNKKRGERSRTRPNSTFSSSSSRFLDKVEGSSKSRAAIN